MSKAANAERLKIRQAPALMAKHLLREQIRWLDRGQTFWIPDDFVQKSLFAKQISIGEKAMVSRDGQYLKVATAYHLFSRFVQRYRTGHHERQYGNFMAIVARLCTAIFGLRFR